MSRKLSSSAVPLKTTSKCVAQNNSLGEITFETTHIYTCGCMCLHMCLNVYLSACLCSFLCMLYMRGFDCMGVFICIFERVYVHISANVNECTILIRIQHNKRRLGQMTIIKDIFVNFGMKQSYSNNSWEYWTNYLCSSCSYHNVSTDCFCIINVT